MPRGIGLSKGRSQKHPDGGSIFLNRTITAFWGLELDTEDFVYFSGFYSLFSEPTELLFMFERFLYFFRDFFNLGFRDFLNQSAKAFLYNLG